jgi:hypothetical protein
MMEKVVIAIFAIQQKVIMILVKVARLGVMLQPLVMEMENVIKTKVLVPVTIAIFQAKLVKVKKLVVYKEAVEIVKPDGKVINVIKQFVLGEWAMMEKIRNVLEEARAQMENV